MKSSRGILPRLHAQRHVIFALKKSSLELSMLNHSPAPNHDSAHVTSFHACRRRRFPVKMRLNTVPEGTCSRVAISVIEQSRTKWLTSTRRYFAGICRSAHPSRSRRSQPSRASVASSALANSRPSGRSMESISGSRRQNFVAILINARMVRLSMVAQDIYGFHRSSPGGNGRKQDRTHERKEPG